MFSDIYPPAPGESTRMRKKKRGHGWSRRPKKANRQVQPLPPPSAPEKVSCGKCNEHMRNMSTFISPPHPLCFLRGTFTFSSYLLFSLLLSLIVKKHKIVSLVNILSSSSYFIYWCCSSLLNLSLNRCVCWLLSFSPLAGKGKQAMFSFRSTTPLKELPQ